MLAHNLISDGIPALIGSDKGQKVLSLMDECRVSHLPVVDQGVFIGLISDKIIYDFNLIDEPVGKVSDKLTKAHVFEHQHIFEVAVVMYKLKLSVIAVLDESHEYKGAITLHDLAYRFARYFSFQEIGGIIVLEMDENDYSMTQISQIVESNDIRILSSFINHVHETNTFEVVLKLDKEDLSSVVQSFMRYDYNVKNIYLGHSMMNDLYQDRYEQFMKYLNT